MVNFSHVELKLACSKFAPPRPHFPPCSASGCPCERNLWRLSPQGDSSNIGPCPTKSSVSQTNCPLTLFPSSIFRRTLSLPVLTQKFPTSLSGPPSAMRSFEQSCETEAAWPPEAKGPRASQLLWLYPFLCPGSPVGLLPSTTSSVLLDHFALQGFQTDAPQNGKRLPLEPHRRVTASRLPTCLFPYPLRPDAGGGGQDSLSYQQGGWIGEGQVPVALRPARGSPLASAPSASRETAGGWWRNSAPTWRAGVGLALGAGEVSREEAGQCWRGGGWLGSWSSPFTHT